MWLGRATAYEHQHQALPGALSEDTTKGLRKVWFLDVQWSTCPIEVEAQVIELWKIYECGNDHYIIKTSLADLKEEKNVKTNLISAYIRQEAPDIGENELIIIHWWW